MGIVKRALEHGEKLLGMKYSRTYRYKYYPAGSGDCSSFAYACYSAAGFPLLQDGIERITSCYEVYADGFDLKFPAKESDIGDSGKWAPKGFYKTFNWKPGDLIFYCFDKNSKRANKITHVAMCYDKNTILHTANTRENVCKKPMSYGDGSIVAVARIKNDNAKITLPVLTKDNAPKIYVRMMQILLNVGGKNPKLNCDGVWGSKTLAALNTFKAAYGLPQDGICDGATWSALRGEIGAAVTVRPESTVPVFEIGRLLKLTTPYMRGEDVKAVQVALNRQGYNCGVADGIFGSKTKNAVLKFQKAKALRADGIVGKDTTAALGGKWK